MRWDKLMLDGDAGSRILLEATKNGDDHLVPLSAAALKVLKDIPRIVGCDYVFVGCDGNKPLGKTALKWALDKAVVEIRAGEPEEYRGQCERPRVMHDVRRTFTTGPGELGTDMNVVDWLKAHRCAACTSVRGHYNHSRRYGERRELWAAYIAYAVETGGSASADGFTASRLKAAA